MIEIISYPTEKIKFNVCTYACLCHDIYTLSRAAHHKPAEASGDCSLFRLVTSILRRVTVTISVIFRTHSLSLTQLSQVSHSCLTQNFPRPTNVVSIKEYWKRQEFPDSQRQRFVQDIRDSGDVGQRKCQMLMPVTSSSTQLVVICEMSTVELHRGHVL